MISTPETSCNQLLSTIFFDENNVNGLESISAKCLEQLGFYIKIFIILYADDTVIMSEAEEGLQALLNFEQYCDL